MNLNDTDLLIEVDSAVWATQLRYRTADLLYGLRNFREWEYIQSIQFKVRPQANPIEPKSPEPQALSAASKSNIRSLAESIENPKLKAALLKLGK